MHRKRHCVELLSVTTLTLVSLVCFAFVNDTDIPITGEKHSMEEDLVIPFQEALDRWAGGLTVIGEKFTPKFFVVIWSIMFGLELNEDTEQLKKGRRNSH